MHKLKVKRGQWKNIINEVVVHEVCEDPDCKKAETTMYYPMAKDMFCTGCDLSLRGNDFFRFAQQRINYHLSLGQRMKQVA